MGKLIDLAAGVIRKNPNAIRTKAMIMPPLYPAFFNIPPDTAPNTRNAEKVAVITRYDIDVEIWNASWTKGIKKALIPREKPSTPYIAPINNIGTIIFLFLVFIIA